MSSENVIPPLDRRRIEETLTLAAQSASTAYPGPMEACSLVCSSGRVIRALPNRALAEDACTAALRTAGEDAHGATAYLVLEPSIVALSGERGARSSVEAMLHAGVARVVGCTESFDPALAGRGYDALRKAGVDVLAGVHADAARRLNRAYVQWKEVGLPYVSVFLSMTPVERTASSAAAWLRHAHDAILTDIEHVLTDPDDLFLDLSGLPRSRPLVRLLYDPILSIDPASLLVASWNNDLILLTTNADADRVDAARGVGIAVESFDLKSESAPWRTILAAISDLPVQKLLVEATDLTSLALLKAGLVNELLIGVPENLIPAPWSEWVRGKPTRLIQIPASDGKQMTSWLLAERLELEAEQP